VIPEANGGARGFVAWVDGTGDKQIPRSARDDSPLRLSLRGRAGVWLRTRERTLPAAGAGFGMGAGRAGLRPAPYQCRPLGAMALFSTLICGGGANYSLRGAIQRIQQGAAAGGVYSGQNPAGGGL
jgi:hypothetical protein